MLFCFAVCLLLMSSAEFQEKNFLKKTFLEISSEDVTVWKFSPTR